MLHFNYENFGLTNYVKSDQLKEFHEFLQVGSYKNTTCHEVGDEKVIQTLDVFNPIVDDPYWFGSIVAASTLNNIYSYNAKPFFAMSIIGTDKEHFKNSVNDLIFVGAKEKLKEGGVELSGGKEVETNNLIFGLHITGSTKKIWEKNNIEVGDNLILTKPLGSGFLAEALKLKKITDKEIKNFAIYASTLNSDVVRTLSNCNIKTCVNIDNGGLFGALRRISSSNFYFEIKTNSIKFLPGVNKYLTKEFFSYEANKNKYLASQIVYNEDFDVALCDPTINGGFIFSVSDKETYKVLKQLEVAGCLEADIIGTVKDNKAKHKFSVILM